MDIAVEKKDIIKWINSIDNPVIQDQNKKIQKSDTVPFDFEKEWENGITIEEARKKTSEFIKSLPWEKQ